MRYFTNAWVCIKILRQHGCKLPIQIWYLGPEELDERMEELVRPLGVECVDGRCVREQHPVRTLNGWELKPYAIIHSPFHEVLLLDSDNVPLKDPEFLFSTPQFKKTGAIFWPDYGRLDPHRSVWKVCGIRYRDEPEFESGQIVIDKRRCWNAMQLCMWYNEFSDFFYNHVHGDKETFHLAFRKLDQPYSMPDTPIHPLEATMCQHDFDGNRLFQHRNLDKWALFRENARIHDFQMEDDCLRHLAALRKHWDGVIKNKHRYSPEGKSKAELDAANDLTSAVYRYRRIAHDERAMHFCPNGLIGLGAAGCETYWNVEERPEGVTLLIASSTEITATLRRDVDGAWRGRWLVHERMPIEILRIDYEWQSPAPCAGQTINICAVVRHAWANGLHRALISDLSDFGLEIQEATLEEESASWTEQLSASDFGEAGFSGAILRSPNAKGDTKIAASMVIVFDIRRLTPALKCWLNTLQTVVCGSERLALWLTASNVNAPVTVLKRSPAITAGIATEAGGKEAGICRFGACFSDNEPEFMAETMAAFLRAFPNEQDVLLSLIAPQGEFQPTDSRIQFISGNIGDAAWTRWLSKLDCVVVRGSVCAIDYLEDQAVAHGISLVGPNTTLLGTLPAVDIRYPYHTLPVSSLPNCELTEESIVRSFRKMRLLLQQARDRGENAALVAATQRRKHRESYAWEIASRLGVQLNVKRPAQSHGKLTICAVIDSDIDQLDGSLVKLVNAVKTAVPEVLLYCPPESLSVVAGIAARSMPYARIVVGSEKMKPTEKIFAALSRGFAHSEHVLIARNNLQLTSYQAESLLAFLDSEHDESTWGITFIQDAEIDALHEQESIWLNPCGFAIKREQWFKTTNWGNFGRNDFSKACTEHLRLREMEIKVVSPRAPQESAVCSLEDRSTQQGSNCHTSKVLQII